MSDEVLRAVHARMRAAGLRVQAAAVVYQVAVLRAAGASEDQVLAYLREVDTEGLDGMTEECQVVIESDEPLTKEETPAALLRQELADAWGEMCRALQPVIDAVRAILRHLGEVFRHLAEVLRRVARFVDTYRGARRAHLRAIHTAYPRRWRLP